MNVAREKMGEKPKRTKKSDMPKVSTMTESASVWERDGLRGKTDGRWYWAEERGAGESTCKIKATGIRTELRRNLKKKERRRVPY